VMVMVMVMMMVMVVAAVVKNNLHATRGTKRDEDDDTSGCITRYTDFEK
jgi:hypothetical protein